MKRLLALTAFLLSGFSLYSQTVTVSASHLTDAAGNPLNGTMYFRPAQAFKVTGQVINSVVSATVTGGAFSLTLADTSQSNPLNACYVAWAEDQNSNVVLGAKYAGTEATRAGYGCVQVSSSWCTSGSCNFDNFVPTGSPLTVVQTGPAATVTIGSVTSGTPAVTNSGSSTNAVLNFQLPTASTALTDSSSLVRNNSTLPQTLLGPLLAASVSGNPTVDGTPTTGAAWKGTYSSGGTYPACSAVKYSGTNYVATNASGPTNPQTPSSSGAYWFPALNTQSSFTPTQMDCAWYEQLGVSLTSGLHPSLHLGSAGLYPTCAGINLGNSQGSAVPNLVGEGANWAGGGSNVPTTTIQAICGTPVISHQDIPSGSGGLANFMLINIMLDANFQGRCGDLFGMEHLVMLNDACKNGNDTDHWLGIGDYTNPGGSYNLVEDLRLDDLTVSAPSENGPTNWAVVSLASGTGAPSIMVGGSYQQPSPLPVFSGYCSGSYPVYGTPTMGTLGAGVYTVTAFPSFVAGSGCVNPQLAVPDYPQVRTGLMLNANDSIINNVKVWGVGQVQGILTGGSNLTIYGLHGIGTPVQVYDTGGATYYSPEFDSPLLYGIWAHSKVSLYDPSLTWNSAAYNTPLALIYLDSLYTNSSIFGGRCGQNQPSNFTIAWSTGGQFYATNPGSLFLDGVPQCNSPSGAAYGTGLYSLQNKIFANQFNGNFSGSETVTSSATPVFATAVRTSVMTLSTNVTTFTLPSASDGLSKVLTFCQPSSGGPYTISPPANVHGASSIFTAMGTMSGGRCGSWTGTFNLTNNVWYTDGATNQ